MPDVLQQHLQGSTRAAVESDLTEGEIGINTDPDFKELILEVKVTLDKLHFPSEEKLAQVIKSTKSGAQFIGVDGVDFDLLTGGVNVQAVLEQIDGILSTLDPVITGGPYLRQDGGTVLTANWNVGGVFDIQNPANLYVGGSTGPIVPRADIDFNLGPLSVIGGIIDQFERSSSSSEIFQNGAFAGATGWGITGGWSIVTDAFFDDSVGAGTLTQEWTDLGGKFNFAGHTWYAFKYTVVNEPTPTEFIFTLESTTTNAIQPLGLNVSDGTHTVYFKTGVEFFQANIFINAVSPGGGPFTGGIRFDDVSLEKIDASLDSNPPENISMSNINIQGQDVMFENASSVSTFKIRRSSANLFVHQQNLVTSEPASGITLGRYTFGVYDKTNSEEIEAGNIEGFTDQIWTYGDTDLGARLDFRVIALDTNVLQRMVSINSSARLVLDSTAGTQLQFSELTTAIAGETLTRFINARASDGSIVKLAVVT